METNTCKRTKVSILLLAIALLACMMAFGLSTQALAEDADGPDGSDSPKSTESVGTEEGDGDASQKEAGKDASGESADQSENASGSASSDSPKASKTPGAGKSVKTQEAEKWGDCVVTVNGGTITVAAGQGASQESATKSPWTEYLEASKITKIVFSGKVELPANSSYLFSGLSALKEIEGLDNLDSSKVTNTSSMFSGCSALTSLDLSDFNTSSVTSSENMFSGCTALESIEVGTTYKMTGNSLFPDAKSAKGWWSKNSKTWFTKDQIVSSRSNNADTYTSKGDISTATVTVSDQTYSGKALTPEPTVKLNGETLTKGTDYTVTYSNNTNVGTATAKVEGAGDYAGTKSTTFAIEAQSVKPTVSLNPSTATYNGSKQEPAITVKVGSKTLGSSDYTATWDGDLVDVGTYKVTVNLKGNYKGTNTAGYEIVAKKTNTYSVSSGGGASWTKGTKTSLKFTIKGSPDDSKTFDAFTGVQVDNKNVDSKYYTTAEGSLILTLSSSYLQSLSTGSHNLKVNFEDGSATAKFTVKAAGTSSNKKSSSSSSKSTTAKTGDSLMTIAIPIALVAIAAIVAVVVALRLRRTR